MLKERGYPPGTIEMIMGENFLRVFQAVVHP
jgi:microsomal dipeptidase-like Zn-dependent dipeptidase